MEEQLEYKVEEVMIKKDQVVLINLLLSFVFFGCTTKLALKNTIGTKPNIILIVTDDMGYMDMACSGNKLVETPNLDFLAKNGINYRYGYASAPLCSPTRASIVTGLSPVRLNLTVHIHGHPPTPKGQKFITPKTAQGLDTSYITLPEVLKKSGYKTAHIGKWHLGGGPYSPEFHGYDFTYAGSWAGLPNSFFYPFFDGDVYPELKADAKEGDCLTDVLTRKSIDWISKNKSKPFYLGLNFYAPHVPIEGKPELVEYYANKKNSLGLSYPNENYAAMIHTIDQNVGKILSYLKTNNMEQNTLVVFTSDNGALDVEEVKAFAKHTPPTKNDPLKGGKGYMSEGGIRVPFIFYWKNIIPATGQVNEPIISTDLMNTFSSLVGQEYRTEDSKDISSTWFGRSLNRNLYWYFPHYSPQKGTPASVVINKNHKLLHDYESGKTMLYDLKADEGENLDISSKQPEIARKLYNELTAWKKSSNAKEMILNNK